MIAAVAGCVYVQSAAVKDAKAKPLSFLVGGSIYRGGPLPSGFTIPSYGRYPYGTPYGRYPYGTPYGNGGRPYYGYTSYQTTRVTTTYYGAPSSAVIMGPYGPYVNGRPVNGGYNPYRPSTAITRPAPAKYECVKWTKEDNKAVKKITGKWSIESERKYCEGKGLKFTRGRDYLAPGCGTCWCCKSKAVSPPPPTKPDVCSYNGKTYKKGETFFKGCSAKCTCLGGSVGCLPVCPMVAPGCGGGRKMSGYEMKPVPGSQCKCRVPKCVVIPGIIMPTRLPPVSAPVFRPTSTRVIMGPYGPYVNGRPVNGGYNPYRRTSTAIVLQPPASSDTRFIGIPSSLVPYPLSVVPPKPDPVGGKCGGTFKISKRGTIIKSPSIKYHYPRFAKCIFKFKAPKGKRVKITFLKMNMEGGKRCLFDSVTIMEKGKKVAKICGNTERGYTLKGRAGTIIFKSDGSVQKNGWRAKLTAV